MHNNERGAGGFIKFDKTKSAYFKIPSKDLIRSKLKKVLVEFELFSVQERGRFRATKIRLAEKKIFNQLLFSDNFDNFLDKWRNNENAQKSNNKGNQICTHPR